MYDILIPSLMEAQATISSSFRSRKHNVQVEGVARSWHCVGLAFDITDWFNEEAKELLIWRLRKLGFQVLDETDHIHVEAF